MLRFIVIAAVYGLVVVMAYFLSKHTGQHVGALPYGGYCIGKSFPWSQDVRNCPHAPSGCRLLPGNRSQVVSDFGQMLHLSPFVGSRLLEWPLLPLLLAPPILSLLSLLWKSLDQIVSRPCESSSTTTTTQKHPRCRWFSLPISISLIVLVLAEVGATIIHISDIVLPPLPLHAPTITSLLEHDYDYWQDSWDSYWDDYHPYQPKQWLASHRAALYRWVQHPNQTTTTVGIIPPGLLWNQHMNNDGCGEREMEGLSSLVRGVASVSSLVMLMMQYRYRCIEV
jgi:hypothetical protein